MQSFIVTAMMVFQFQKLFGFCQYFVKTDSFIASFSFQLFGENCIF